MNGEYGQLGSTGTRHSFNDEALSILFMGMEQFSDRRVCTTADDIAGFSETRWQPLVAPASIGRYTGLLDVHWSGKWRCEPTGDRACTYGQLVRCAARTCESEQPGELIGLVCICLPCRLRKVRGSAASYAPLVRLDRIFVGNRLPDGEGRHLGLRFLLLDAGAGRHCRHWEVGRHCGRAAGRTCC